MRVIDADKTIGLLKTRLYETALNNSDAYCSASYLYKECADNRIETWINEAPTIEPETAEWISTDCETYDKMICSNCGNEPIISIDDENNVVYWLTPYCPFCGRKNKINLKEG